MKPVELVQNHVRYHWNVNLLGRSFLRYQRVRSSLKNRKPGRWKHPHLAPPHDSALWLKELISQQYLEGRYVNLTRKVAWVTSGAPIEFLKALGYYLWYPENHGAVCGVRHRGEEIAGYAEDAGYSRDICSYARCDIGTVLSGKSPVGEVPRPDLLVCCTNICQTVLHWYRVLAEHFRVPLILIDTPFIYDTVTEHSFAFVRKQLDEAFEVAERVAGRSIDPKKLKRVMELSRDAVVLWAEIMEKGRARPAPILAFDEFFHMSPIVQMRGEEYTVRYYRALVAELDRRIAQGMGAVYDEKKRVIWDNLPVWFRVREFSDMLSAHGVAMVASTYTNAWGELADMMDPDRALDSATNCYLHVILNQGTGHKLKTMNKMVTEYDADGVILHSDRSCKPYSIGQMDQTSRLANQLGVPALLLEADHNDPRSYSDEQGTNRIEAFMEVLGV